MGLTRLLLFSLFSLVLTTKAWAQVPAPAPVQDPAKDVFLEVSAHLGNLLPNQVAGVTEITPQWGVRVGIPTGEGVVELGGMAGKGNGVDWSSLSISLRSDFPIETLTGLVYLGGDVHSYQAGTLDRKTFGGGHMGGGVMAAINKRTWFRADMKFNINPGTSLYIGGGFIIRFGADSAR